jgi:putative FmdB family regulatory protein
MILHDYRCTECGLTEERFVKADEHIVACNKCQGAAKRITLKAPNPDWAGLAMGESASPEAINRFERTHKQRKDKEEKTYRTHGDYGPAAGA